MNSHTLLSNSLTMIGATMLVLLASCGGSPLEPPPAPTVVLSAATPVPSPTPIPLATPTPAPTAVPTALTSSVGSLDSDLLAQGKEIFEKTAGGVGCAYCHGMRGEGDGPSGMGAPPNKGKPEERLRWALAGGDTDAMLFIDLSAREIKAVVAYLQYLGEQP